MRLPLRQNITLLNPLTYPVSGFRRSYCEIANVSIVVSLTMITVFLLICILLVWRIFATG